MDKFISCQVPEHAIETLHGLDGFRRDFPELCDFTLIIDEQKFPCHRAILCLYSEYFRGMIRGKFFENDANVTTLKGINPESLTAILDYLYTGKIEINQASVESILETASRLQIQKVIGICVSYLRHQINETNSLAMHRFGEAQGLPGLAEAAKNYTYERMEAIFEVDDVIRDMTSRQVDEILQDNLAHLHGEEQLITSILKWISFDQKERLPEIEKLMQNIDWYRVSTRFILRNLFYHPLLKTNKKAKRLIVGEVRKVLDEVKHSEQLHTGLTLNEITEQDYQPQSTFSLHWDRSERMRVQDQLLGGEKSGCVEEVLLLVGGLTLGEAERGDTTQPNVMCYFPRSHTWKARANWPERKLRGFSVTKFHNDVIVTGGCDYIEMKRNDINRAWMYVVDGDKWERLPDMTYERSFHCSCEVNGEIFVVGGAHNHKIDIEVLDPHACHWTVVKETAPKFVWNFTIAACNGKILLIGSAEKSRSLVLQCYNPAVAQWSLFRSPDIPRLLSAPLCTTSRENELVFLSGDNSQKMFVFDPNKNKWSRCRDMQDLHANGGVATVGRTIYLSGGHWEDDGYWDEMESFDIEKGVWTSRGPLPHLWLYHGCASVVISK